MKKVNNVFMYTLGALIVIGFFVALVYMSANNADGKYTNSIMDMVATIKMTLVLIVGYYWGSSKSSADKTEMLNKG
ncbi:MAG: hypothetical protein NTZ33_13790 [Bacteroidetes bacterium]|nr:hypothetical protein [Bacteroidota bacterium]